MLGRPPSAPPAPGAPTPALTSSAPTPSSSTPARRPGECLTSPDRPAGNGGRDNEHSDLIMRVGDALLNERGVRCVGN
jgi:hypothetical protein